MNHEYNWSKEQNTKMYDSYDEAIQRETVKNIAKQTEELEMRKKLEESLNILALFAIIAIIILVVIKVLTVLGIIGAVQTATEIVGGCLNCLL